MAEVVAEDDNAQNDCSVTAEEENKVSKAKKRIDLYKGLLAKAVCRLTASGGDGSSGNQNPS